MPDTAMALSLIYAKDLRTFSLKSIIATLNHSIISTEHLFLSLLRLLTISLNLVYAFDSTDTMSWPQSARLFSFSRNQAQFAYIFPI